MPLWLRRLIDFLKGFIPAVINSYLAERKRQQAIADSGAAQQRAADQAAEDKITAEARGRHEETVRQTDTELDDRLDRWRGVRKDN